MSQVPSDELSNSVSKLVELNKQITEAREDIKVLVQAEKSLKLQVKKLMVDHGLDAINLKKGKISVRKSSRKTGLNKTTVEGLVNYFNGNERQAESVLKAILDNLPVRNPFFPSRASKTRNNGLERVCSRRRAHGDNEYSDDEEYEVEMDKPLHEMTGVDIR